MASEFTRKLTRFIIKYKWSIVIANILLLLWVLKAFSDRIDVFTAHSNYMKHIVNNPLDKDSAHIDPPPIFNGDYHIWFDENEENLVAFDEHQKIFSKEENLILVLVAKNGDIFTKENLKTLIELTDSAWTVPYVNRVDGLSNFNYTYVQDDDLLVEAFIPEIPENDSLLQVKKRMALNDPLMPHFLISEKADITQIQLRAIVPPAFPEGFKAVKYGMLRLIENAKKSNPNIEVYLGGTVALNTAFEETAVYDMEHQMPFMFLFIIVVLFISLRSIVATVSPIILLLTSVLFPIALFVGYFNMSLDNMTMNVMQILLAVAIADSVHILAVFYKALRAGMDKYKSLEYTIEKTFIACMLTSVTTAIGFFSLLLMEIPPFQYLGLFAGVGTVYAFFSSMFTLTALLAILPFKTREKTIEDPEHFENSGFEKLTAFVVKHQKLLRRFTIISTLIFLALSMTIYMDNNPLKYFTKETDLRIATDYIDNNILGVNLIEFNFDSGEENGAYNPNFLNKIERFKQYIESRPDFDISFVSSINDVIKRIHMTMNGNKQSFYQIPQNEFLSAEGDTVNGKRLIAQYMFLYQMSLPQGMEVTNQIDINNRYARVIAYMRSETSTIQLKRVAEMENWLKETFPDDKIKAVGVPIMFAHLMINAIPQMIMSLFVSFVFITMSIMITFRSFKLGLYSMVPNLWPMFVVFGVIGLVQFEVNLGVAVVGMITLGIVVDDTIHFLSKYLAARKKGKSAEEAILLSYRQVGHALFYTSLILIFGFLAMISSSFVPNVNFSILCSSIIALALFADLILLPAILLKFDK